MRLALASAALTFSFLLSPAALAQTSGGASGTSTQGTGTGGSSDTQSGTGGTGTSQSPSSGSTGGTYSTPPQGTTGTQQPDNTGTGGAGTSNPGMYNTGTGTPDAGGTGGAGNQDMNNPGMGAPDAGGTGGAGSTTQPGTGGSDIDGTGGGTTGSGSTTTPDTSGTGGSGTTNPNDGTSPNMGSHTQASSGTSTNPRGAARATDERAQTRNADALASGKAESPEELTAEVAQLRSDVQRLQRQVNTLQGGHADKSAEQGTGGSGNTSANRGANPDKTVVASVVMSGQVASARQGRVVVRDAESGDLYNLRVGQGTQVLHDGQRVSAEQLRQGTPIQASYNLVANGDSYATRLQVAPTRQPRQAPPTRR
ncbi:hypothetical protein LY474_23490 [Myxococcus stipitatus]|uniref:hypothetical protein n=1 Tax=Myxococcus stipitatus TaxID=83455 RepID=UPI001F26C7CE|nr:hypothetical protein [Myxococcus stipitatus]MCE9670775.1 hypothetical protein [Myxococcus stipitatus]